MKIFFRVFLMVSFSSLGFWGCAPKRVKLWIEPPSEESDYVDSQKIQYQIVDSSTGKTERFLIPVKKIPETVSVVVEDKSLAHSSQEAVTRIDKELFSQGKAPGLSGGSKKPRDPSISLVNGLPEVKKLYAKGEYSKALVKAYTLVDQYPKEIQLYVMIGTLLQKMGNKKLALEYYKKGKEMDANNAELEGAVLKLQSELGE